MMAAAAAASGRVRLACTRARMAVEAPRRWPCASLRAASACSTAATHPPSVVVPPARREALPVWSARPTVVVALSGGVDSSLTAALLAGMGDSVAAGSVDARVRVASGAGWRAGAANVVGVFMENWDPRDEDGSGEPVAGKARACAAEVEWDAARAAAAAVGIPLTRLSFTRQYWVDVFSPFVDAYARGLTPNPDILCNRHVKFGALRRVVFGDGDGDGDGIDGRRVAGDFLATGHFARLSPPITDPTAALPAAHQLGNPAVPALLSADDMLKDQSDFLAGVPGAALKRVVLPLAHLPKSRVRQLAAALGLPAATKRDSYGICFVGKRPLTQFLGDYLTLSPGHAVDVDSGARVGALPAVQALTVGQGARISGTTTKYYVVHTRSALPPASGSVYVAAGRHHPALFTDTAVLALRDVMWSDPSVQVVAATPRPPYAVPAALAPLVAAAVARASGSTAAIPTLPAKYRIRHRQQDMGDAEVSVATRAEVEAAGTARVAAAAAPGDAPRVWQLGAPPTHTPAAAATLPDVDPTDLLLCIRFPSALQRAVAPGQVLVLYSHDTTPPPPPPPGAEHELEQGAAWKDAGRTVLGCGPLLCGGPSQWDLRLPAPDTSPTTAWVE